jgi:menaquinone-dependent protoporphyrinogen oxidase
MSMRVLVTVASKHGNTQGIGEAIGAALTDAGLEVAVRAPAAMADLDEFRAVIVGSAVYVGKWLPEARRFVERHADELRRRPVWFFSSGPLGDPPKPAEDPVDVAPMTELVGARGHRLFTGNLDREQLGFGERAVTRMVGAPYGDFRPWAEIRAWADEIAGALRSVAVG